MYWKNTVFILMISVFLLSGCKQSEKTMRLVEASKRNAVDSVMRDVLVLQNRVDELEASKNNSVYSSFSEATYQPSKTSYFDLVHTSLKVQFDWDKSQLKGIAALELKPHFYATDTLVLDAKSFDIHKVELVENKRTI